MFTAVMFRSFFVSWLLNSLFKDFDFFFLPNPKAVISPVTSFFCLLMLKYCTDPRLELGTQKERTQSAFSSQESHRTDFMSNLWENVNI